MTSVNKLSLKGNWLVVILVAIVVVAGAGRASWRILNSRSDSSSNKIPSLQSSLNAKDNSKQSVKPEELATGTVIKSDQSKFGAMLFNDKQQAMYIWQLEDSTTPKCYGNCAEAWPPVLTSGVPRAAGEVDGNLLGTTKRTDGSTQVTYNGHPLYYYANEGPGEVECHNIRTHGGLWWVIHPNGLRAE